MILNKISIILLLLSIIVVSLLCSHFIGKEGYDDLSENNIDIVISRYNEKLDWLQNEPFNQIPIIIYNKGVNDDYYKPEKLKNDIKLENIGRTSHTIFYHIINNYDNLANVTIFLHGSSDNWNKYENAVKLTENVKKHNKSVFVASKYDDIKTDMYDFTLDNYSSTDNSNFKVNPENELILSDIRPFGKWYESLFGDIKTNYVSYTDMIAVSKEHIRQHPIEYYENLINQTNTGSNTETGHYFERAWEAVFYPMDGLIVV
jgi:hypothetical protein